MPSVFLFYPLRAVEANEGASPQLSLSLFFPSEEKEKSLLSSLSPVSFPADAGEEGERERISRGKGTSLTSDNFPQKKAK